MTNQERTQMMRSKRLAVAGILGLVSLSTMGHALALTEPVDLVAKRRATVVAAADANQPVASVSPVSVSLAPTVQKAIEIKKAEPTVWEVRPEETMLATVLDRWSREAGYRFRWTAPKEHPAFPLTIHGTFEEALSRIMKDTRATRYPIRACIYLNRTVRIIHAADSCTR
ncbi:TcpQ domain-containing protein [Cupriavidus pauculus]|uniref:TcpQ domain-containing protein n=1 Tax=Cupriavidus pauculus TaxID=82633 RepID=UPI0038578013